MNDNEKTKQFLSEQQFMVIAVTQPDGTPWAVPVKIARREGNVFEWDSMLETEHSKALSVQPIMAITIYQKTDDVHIGFYAKGLGELIEEYKPGFGHYRFTAEACWLNDETLVKRAVEL
jgi:hypothetical protein